MLKNLFKKKNPRLNKGYLLVQTSIELLSSNTRQAHLAEIRQLCGLSSHDFSVLYLSAINNFSAYVQQLPASEAHHHSGPGGMLDHTLEVVVSAMKLRKSVFLPEDEKPEAIREKEHVWTYAVFLSALLHDIGKVIVSFNVNLYNKKGKELGSWQPLSGPMSVGDIYKPQFVHGQQYQLHQQIASTIVTKIVPDIGVRWITDEQGLLGTWLSAITGQYENAGKVGEIVQRADSDSVARNLGAGNSSRLATSTTIPLHDKLLTGLRFLLASQDFPLNKRGAAAWTTEEAVWMVSKRVVDALRGHLHQEGHSGVPGNNNRMLDILQEHGIIKANKDKAIWNVRVEDAVEDREKTWYADLSMLKADITRIWPNPDARPAQYNGSITVLMEVPDGGEKGKEESLLAQSAEDAVIQSSKEMEEVEVPQGEFTLPPIVSRAEKEPQKVDDDIDTQREQVSDNLPAEEVTKEKIPLSFDEIDPGHIFLQWVIDGLNTGKLKMNLKGAQVHVVNEGVLLVSPIIFKKYAGFKGNDYMKVQTGLKKLHLHKKTEKGLNVWHYYIKSGEIKLKDCKEFSGWLIPNEKVESAFPGIKFPEPNPILILANNDAEK